MDWQTAAPVARSRVKGQPRERVVSFQHVTQHVTGGGGIQRMVGPLVDVTGVAGSLNEIGGVFVGVVGIASLRRRHVDMQRRFEKGRTSVLVFRRLGPKPVRQRPGFGRGDVIAQRQGLILQRRRILGRTGALIGNAAVPGSRAERGAADAAQTDAADAASTVRLRRGRTREIGRLVHADVGTQAENVPVEDVVENTIVVVD